MFRLKNPLSTLAILSLAGSTIFGGYANKESAPEGESQLVDIKADLVYPHKINDTTSVLCLVGRFAAQHNGAVITADSAVRYGDDRLECFGNVLINKNTTYAYADRAEYDGAKNLASLYAPLVKVVDQDVTMYSYNFTFNTLDNVGNYWGGGLTTKVDEQSGEVSNMESERGYYYADFKRVVGVERVELQGEGYELKGDSVIYEMESERAYFFDNTNIWNEESDFIYGDNGHYDKASDLYLVNKNGYLLTKEQEVWSDSMEYYRTREEAILRGNIQIDDTTNMVLAFGDYAQYWGAKEEVLLTKRPTVISYDTSQGDSVFLSGDTIRMVSFLWGEGPAAEQARDAMASQNDVLAELMGVLPTDSVEVAEVEGIDDKVSEEFDVKSIVDSTKIETETIPEEPKQPTKREIKAQLRDSIRSVKLRASEVRFYRKLVARRDAAELRLEERRAKGRNIFPDSLTVLRLSKEIASTRYMLDSLALLDTIGNHHPTDTIVVAQLDTLGNEPDSLYRIVKVFRNSRVYRSDFQVMSDSLVAISYDTTMKAYINPVVWSEQHQITADEMRLYTLDGNLDYAEFIGKPVMSSQVIPGDTSYFNQVSGKEMVARFRDNNIYRNDVDANVETVYYMQDEESQEVNTVSNVESGSASFLIDSQQLEGIIYRQEPTYIFAPLDKLPPDIKLNLENFKWHGAERPTRQNIFTREIRPTKREAMSVTARPLFPIMEGIEAKRKSLTNSGVWRDRTDRVSKDATDWMRSLGFTPGEPRAEGDNPF